MPDFDDSVDDPDWELIEEDAKELRDVIAEWAETVREPVQGMVVELPDGCIGRSKEKWRPLKPIAVVAGGRWPAGEKFMETSDLVSKLIGHNHEYWGANSNYRKALTGTRFAQIVMRASRVTPQRVGGRGPRGYLRSDLDPFWRRHRMGPGAPGDTGELGASESNLRQLHQANRSHQLECGCPEAAGIDHDQVTLNALVSGAQARSSEMAGATS